MEKLDSAHRPAGKKPQAALVALDPHTGNVLAMVGGRSYAESQLNRVTDAHRQPGSTFKPFVYAAALEAGMSPVQTFRDAPREFVYSGNRIYRPANYGSAYSFRDVTMRSALVKSLNVVTVDVALQTGLARIARLAENLGLPRPERYPSLALGTTEVTPLQLAAAYASFVNGGRKVEPKVVVSMDEPPAMHKSLVTEQQVMSPTTAYMVTNMLSGVIERGTARSVRSMVSGTAVAGKTGTSRDGWFVGFTPNLVCVVWVGFDDNSQLGLTGAESALPIWSEFIGNAIASKPELGSRTFACPEGIKFVEIDSDTGLLSTLGCPHRELIAVTDRTGPNLECYLHGNLPNSLEDEPEVWPGPTYTPDAEPFAKERNLRQQRFDPGKRELRTTRVEVDDSGRRTLVNNFD
jgi:penicillin-binding protein 1B